MKLKVIAAINESYIYTRLDTGYGQITNSQIGNEYKISFWKAPGSKGGGLDSVLVQEV